MNTSLKQKQLSERGMSSHKIPYSLYILAAFILIGCVLYSVSLFGEFIWDDIYLIKDNLSIKSFANSWQLFVEDQGAGAGESYAFYRPLSMFTYAVNYMLGGLNVFGYHLLNVMLHILVSFCLFIFLKRLFKDEFIALVCSLFFLVHPVQVESVAYISGRSDLLSALFMLIGLIAYSAYCDTRKKSKILLCYLCYVLALFSKENAVIFPAVLLLYHATTRRRLRVIPFLVTIVFSIGYIFIRMRVLGSTDSTAVFTGLGDRTPGVFAAVVTYLRLLVFPVDLHMAYGDKAFSVLDPRVCTGIVITGVCLGAALLYRKKNPLFFFSVFWFFITILPVVNLYPVAFYMAEHYLYVPSMGFFLIIASFVARGVRNSKTKYISLLILAVFVAVPVFLTIRQNVYWQKAEAFYVRTLQYEPDNARVLNNLASLYLQTGKEGSGLRLLTKAVEDKPDRAQIYNNLGVLYYQRGDNARALEYYKKALMLDNNYPRARNNIALVYSDAGLLQQAKDVLLELLKDYPENTDANYNLGVVLEKQNNIQGALERVKNVLLLDADYCEAYNNLGNLYRGLQDYVLAERNYKKALSCNPLYVQAMVNLGNFYASRKEMGHAIYWFNEALKLKPDSGEVHNTLALVYLVTGNPELARNHRDKAVALGVHIHTELEEMDDSYSEGSTGSVK